MIARHTLLDDFYLSTYLIRPAFLVLKNISKPNWLSCAFVEVYERESGGSAKSSLILR